MSSGGCSARSMCSAMGATSFSANSRKRSRNITCSSVSAKSIPAPSARLAGALRRLVAALRALRFEALNFGFHAGGLLAQAQNFGLKLGSFLSAALAGARLLPPDPDVVAGGRGQ